MPDGPLPHYVKWVRYYLDFSEKYAPEGSREQRVAAFDRKLKGKRQSESLWGQARQAVELFLEMSDVSDVHAKDFLTELAVGGSVVASTQNQAFNALLFFFRHVLQREYELGDRVVRAKTSNYIPTVLTRAEVDEVLSKLSFPYDLLVATLYGCGLRITECLELRVSSLDLEE